MSNGKTKRGRLSILRRRPADVFEVGAVVATVAALVLSNSSPAAADVFEVGVVVTGVEEARDAFIDGFRLAVDQSPDVSHPPGIEGGDHLGSMDVVLVIVAVGDQDPPAMVAEGLVRERKVPILVVDSQVEVTARGVTIAVVETGEHSESSGVFVTTVEEVHHLLTDRDPGFSRAFRLAYGEAPSAAAARGYVAGRLVDLAVEATNRDPSDSSTLSRALEATRHSSEDLAPSDDAGDGRWGAGIVVIGAALTAILVLGRRRTWRQRSSGNNGGPTSSIEP